MSGLDDSLKKMLLGSCDIDVVDHKNMAIAKIGKFTVLDTLGSGANSSILHIRREEDGREYALKLVPIEDEDDLKFTEVEFQVGGLTELSGTHPIEETRWPTVDEGPEQRFSMKWQSPKALASSSRR